MTSKGLTCLDKHDCADNSDGEAEQHARIVPNLGRATKERRDLSSRRAVGAITALGMARGTSTSTCSSGGGVSHTAARAAVGDRRGWSWGRSPHRGSEANAGRRSAGSRATRDAGGRAGKTSGVLWNVSKGSSGKVWSRRTLATPVSEEELDTPEIVMVEVDVEPGTVI